MTRLADALKRASEEQETVTPAPEPTPVRTLEHRQPPPTPVTVEDRHPAPRPVTVDKRHPAPRPVTVDNRHPAPTLVPPVGYRPPALPDARTLGALTEPRPTVTPTAAAAVVTEPTSAPAELTRHRWFPDQVITTHEDLHSDTGGPPRFSERLREKLVTDRKSRPAAVEQYRRLAAALHHSQQQFGTKVVMVASALGSEGKSLSVCNLALTLSHSYRRRVLLIDADLRRPSLHEMFQLPATSGLSEGLRGSAERAMPLFEVSSRLMVLPSGRPDPDPIGGLASERMAGIVAEAASLFDWVLIDTPPVGLVPDAKVLSALVDAAVLVILAGKSPSALVRQAIDALGPEKIFGVVLNAAETASTLHTSGYYGIHRG